MTTWLIYCLFDLQTLFIPVMVPAIGDEISELWMWLKKNVWIASSGA